MAVTRVDARGPPLGRVTKVERCNPPQPAPLLTILLEQHRHGERCVSGRRAAPVSLINSGASSKNPPSDESDYDSDVSTSSSDTVEEDEFGEELTPALDAAILQTLGRIKRKEGVYGSENVLQEALQAAEKRAGSLGVKALKRVVEDKVRHLVAQLDTTRSPDSHTCFRITIGLLYLARKSRKKMERQRR